MNKHKTTTHYYYSRFDPTSVYICRGVLADALRVDKFYRLRNVPDEELKIEQFTIYSNDSNIPDEVYPVYQKGKLKSLMLSKPKDDDNEIISEPLFVVKQNYVDAKPNTKHLVNIYDNERGYACRINTNPAERGRLAEGKVYFMDDLWKNEAHVGVGEVYITSELETYGYVTGTNIRIEFPTKDDLMTIKNKNPNAHLRRVKSIDPEHMGDICYNSNNNMIIFRAKELFEIESWRFVANYVTKDQQEEMKNAINNSVLIDLNNL